MPNFVGPVPVVGQRKLKDQNGFWARPIMTVQFLGFNPYSHLYKLNEAPGSNCSSSSARVSGAKRATGHLTVSFTMRAKVTSHSDDCDSAAVRFVRVGE